jgi:hypothetical protein
MQLTRAFMMWFVSLPLMAADPAGSADPDTVILQRFETESPFTGNQDGGTPPSVRIQAGDAHGDAACAVLEYKNPACGYGNLRMSIALCGAEQSIVVWLKKINAADQAAMHIWLVEPDGDAWLSPGIILADLAAGWQRVDVRLKDMTFQARGNKKRAIASANHVLVGCNYADITVLIDDISLTGPDLATKRKEIGMITIDPQAVACRNFLGFGAEWDPQFWTNGRIGPDRALDSPTVTEDDWSVLVKRIRFMKLPIVRMMMISRWCTEGDGKYDFENKRMQSLYRHLDVCEKEGTAVMLTEWGCHGWTKPPGFTGNSDPKCAEAIGVYLDHLINKKKYTCIKYFIYVNEPNLIGDWPGWKSGAEHVAKMLATSKLSKQVVFLGSDQNGDHPDWHYRAVDELQRIFGGYEFHRYPPSTQIESRELLGYFTSLAKYSRAKDPKGASKPLIIGEAGIIDPGATVSLNARDEDFDYGIDMADYATQAAHAGISAVCCWMLDDNSIEGFTWGMMRAKSKGNGVKPWFYPWSLLCRTVRPESTLYRIEKTHVPVLAARLPDEKGWSFVLVNRATTETNATLRMANGGMVSLWRYDYKANPLADADGLPKAIGELTGDLDAGVEVALPAQAVVFLTSVEP